MTPFQFALLRARALAGVQSGGTVGGSRVLFSGEPVTLGGEQITHSFGRQDMELLAALQGLQDAGASGALARVLGFQGSSLVRFAPPSLGNVARYPLSVGQQVLTLDMLAGGIVTANAPTGNTVLLIPTLAQLGYTIDPDHPTAPRLLFQRVGEGPFSIAGKPGDGGTASAVYINWQVNPADGSNNLLDPQYMLPGSPVGCLIYGGVNAAGKEQWDAC